MIVIYGDPDRALPASTDPEAATLYASALEFLRADDREGALEALAAADERGHPGAPRLLGNFVLDDEPEARKLLGRAYERGDGNAATALGQLAKNRGQIDQAFAFFESADRAGDCEGAKSLGVLLRTRGELDAAEAALRRADSRGGASASHSLGIFYEEARGDELKAERAYRRAIERGHPRSVVRLIAMLAARGETAEIESLRMRAYELLDEHPTIFKDLREPRGAEVVRTIGLREVAATGGGCLLALSLMVFAAAALGLAA